MSEGFYWIKQFSDDDWEVALFDGDRWDFIGSEGGLNYAGEEQPEIIGPMIEPPK